MFVCRWWVEWQVMISSTCKPIFHNISECIKEYGMKINGKKSKVVCINRARKKRSFNFSGCEIGEVEAYMYLGVTVKAGVKKHISNRIREVGKQVWKNGFNDTEREKEYVQITAC